MEDIELITDIFLFSLIPLKDIKLLIEKDTKKGKKFCKKLLKLEESKKLKLDDDFRNYLYKFIAKNS